MLLTNLSIATMVNGYGLIEKGAVLIDGNTQVFLPTGRREGRCEMELALGHASEYTVYTTLYK